MPAAKRPAKKAPPKAEQRQAKSSATLGSAARRTAPKAEQRQGMSTFQAATVARRREASLAAPKKNPVNPVRGEQRQTVQPRTAGSVVPRNRFTESPNPINRSSVHGPTLTERKRQSYNSSITQAQQQGFDVSKWPAFEDQGVKPKRPKIKGPRK